MVKKINKDIVCGWLAGVSMCKWDCRIKKMWRDIFVCVLVLFQLQCTSRIEATLTLHVEQGQRWCGFRWRQILSRVIIDNKRCVVMWMNWTSGIRVGGWLVVGEILNPVNLISLSQTRWKHCRVQKLISKPYFNPTRSTSTLIISFDSTKHT